MIGLPSMVTVPESGFSRPATMEISVVLPAPEYPTTATNSPSLTVRLTSLSTWLRFLPSP